MKPLDLIYWLRAVLGMVIGILCALYIYFSVTSELFSFYTLLTGISFALLFYIATYYVVKAKFYARVEKQSKLMSHGIGIYFFAWVISWTLIVSLLLPSALVSIYNNDVGGLVEERHLWVVARIGNQVFQNVSTLSGGLRLALLPPGAYTLQLGGELSGLNVVNQNQPLQIDWLQSVSVAFNVTSATG